MGKIRQGILGGFNGTTGSVVGASWKGIAYMRGKAQSIKNPRTTAQVDNRTKFGVLSDLMSKAKIAIDNGFLGVALKKSPFNCAVQENMKSYVDSELPLDLSELQFSNGGMLPFVTGSASLSEGTISLSASMSFSYDDDKDVDFVVVYEGNFAGAPYVHVQHETLTSGEGMVTSTVSTPNSITFTKAHCFVFVYDKVAKDASITTYLGEVTPA